MSRLKAFLAVAALSAAFVLPADAYQIGSGSVAKKAFNLHESFTAEARDCLGRSEARVQDCSARLANALDRSREERGTPANTYEYATRWPDDPTRMLDSAPGMIRFGLTFLDECRGPLRRGPAIDQAGLLCVSHFGRMQFMHAQASAGDADSAATRRKLLAWAQFAFKAATDREFRNADYCNTVRAIADPALREALTLSDESLCRSRTRTLLGVFRIRNLPAWRVGTLFALRCSNPLSSTCWEQTDDETARVAAVGAILHLVQDSYSQSHVARVPASEAAPGPRGPFTARIVCRAPAVYYDYQAQNAETPDDQGRITSDPHAVADGKPSLDASCRDPGRQVDDVITASASVLHYVRRNDPQGFRTYLETRVFPQS